MVNFLSFDAPSFCSVAGRQRLLPWSLSLHSQGVSGHSCGDAQWQLSIPNGIVERCVEVDFITFELRTGIFETWFLIWMLTLEYSQSFKNDCDQSIMCWVVAFGFEVEPNRPTNYILQEGCCPWLRTKSYTFKTENGDRLTRPWRHFLATVARSHTYHDLKFSVPLKTAILQNCRIFMGKMLRTHHFLGSFCLNCPESSLQSRDCRSSAARCSCRPMTWAKTSCYSRPRPEPNRPVLGRSISFNSHWKKTGIYHIYNMHTNIYNIQYIYSVL